MRGKTAKKNVFPGSRDIEHCGCSNVEAAAVVWLPWQPWASDIGGVIFTDITCLVFVIKIEQKFQLQQIGFTHSTVASLYNINSMLFNKMYKT